MFGVSRYQSLSMSASLMLLTHLLPQQYPDVTVYHRDDDQNIQKYEDISQSDMKT